MKEFNPFKEKLYDHTMPVGDDLWNRIESQLPVGIEKKKFPFFLIALPFVVLMSGAILFWTLRNGDLQNQEIPAPDKKSIPNTPPTSDDSTRDVSESNTSAVENKTLTASIKDDQHNSSSLNRSKTSSNTVSGNTQASVNSESQSTNKTNSSSGKTNNSSSTGLNTKKSISDGTAYEFSLEENPDPASVSPSALSEDHIEHRSAYLIRHNTLSALPLIDFLHVQDMSGDEDLASAIDRIKPDPSCYKFSSIERKSNLSVDLFAGPGFSPRSFENTSNESHLYAAAREATETSRYAWSGGGRVNLKLNHEWALRIGILYDQAGDVFDYTDTNATKQSTTIDSFFAADGAFLYTESRTILTFGTLIKKIHNRYHHLDIPLLASYELPMGRGTLMLNMGPVINLTTSVRGQILDPALVPKHISQGGPTELKAYKNNVGLSFYLGAGALIPFNENISGLIEPRFLYRIKPVTIDNYPLKEHRHFAGINLGIRYHFD